jgi:hypothetical protein
MYDCSMMADDAACFVYDTAGKWEVGGPGLTSWHQFWQGRRPGTDTPALVDKLVVQGRPSKKVDTAARPRPSIQKSYTNLESGSATITILADNKHTTYCNGQLLGTGTAFNDWWDPQNARPKKWDCFSADGSYVVAINATGNYGGFSSGSGGSLLASVLTDDGRVLNSNADDWKCWAGTGTRISKGSTQFGFTLWGTNIQEEVPEGWTELNFDDSGWPNAASHGANADLQTPWSAGVNFFYSPGNHDMKDVLDPNWPQSANPTCRTCVGVAGHGMRDEAEWIWTGRRIDGVPIDEVFCRGTLRLADATHTLMPWFDVRAELKQQSLVLRHVRVEGNEAFGGGGEGLGAALSLNASTLDVESVDFVGNTQRGVGAGVIFAVNSNATFSFARFEQSRDLGRGAGVLAAAAGSCVVVSHSQFLRNFVEDQMGFNAQYYAKFLHYDSASRAAQQSASCIVVDASALSAIHSLFDRNAGGDVIVARATSSVDLAHTTFRENTVSTDKVGGWLAGNEGSVATISLWEGSVAALTKAAFIRNVGGAAGALWVSGFNTAVSFDQSKFIGNEAIESNAAAGAIFATDHAYVCGTRSTFEGNVAASQLAAGVVYATDAVEITLTDVTLRYNEAHGSKRYKQYVVDSVLGAGTIYADHSSISLVRATVAQNTAIGWTVLPDPNYMDALHINSPRNIFVQDTTFEPLVWAQTVSISPQVLPGLIVQGSCQHHPCPRGQSCAYANFSSSCKPCPEGTYSSDGINCRNCLPAMAPAADQTQCEPCGGPSNPLAYSPYGICLECHGENVVADGHTSCVSCPLGLGPANAERTHCAPCQGDTLSKLGVCEACPSGKIGTDGTSCSDCPPNAEPSSMQRECRCRPGYYNSTYGLIQCKPDAMPAPQDGHVCQPCGPCLDCETSLSTFTRALVQPGYKLGVAASKVYKGVEHGALRVNKVSVYK